VSQTLAWPLLSIAVALLLVGVTALGWWLRSRERPTWVAHTAWLEQVPAVHAALRRDRLARTLAAIGLVTVVVAGVVLAGRPVERREEQPMLGTRDIVLCLDVSGSMLPYDAAILGTFRDLVESFSGERLALSLFNSTSRTVFPLTDDYDLVLDELNAIEQGLDIDILDPNLSDEDIDMMLQTVAGTTGVAGQASLIGDGLAGCTLQFDAQESDRSRSVILATDNMINGDPIYTLDQAADLATSRDVRLYGLLAAEQRDRGTAQDQAFHRAIEDAGGLVWYTEDPAAVQTIVEQVLAEQAAVLDAAPQIIDVDRQGWWVLIAATGVLLLLGARVWGRQ
jgi:Ca-activated chloride channel homolog